MAAVDEPIPITSPPDQMQATAAAAAGEEARAGDVSEAANEAGVEGSNTVVGEAGSAPDAPGAFIIDGAIGGVLTGEEAGGGAPAAAVPASDGGTGVPAGEGTTGPASVPAGEHATVAAGGSGGGDASGNAVGDSYPCTDAEGDAKEGKEQQDGGERKGLVADPASAPRDPGEPLQSNGDEGGQSKEAPVRVVC